MGIAFEKGTQVGEGGECTGESQHDAKHGKGDIEVWFGVRDEMLGLEVIDDGPGFPDRFDPKTMSNTGLELIESLSRWDLRGEVRYENRAEGGACVFVRFPLPEVKVVAVNS